MIYLIQNNWVTYLWFGSRAFSVAGPVAWNGLPTQVRAIHDVIAFESALKTLFFKLAYPNSL